MLHILRGRAEMDNAVRIAVDHILAADCQNILQQPGTCVGRDEHRIREVGIGFLVKGVLADPVPIPQILAVLETVILRLRSKRETSVKRIDHQFRGGVFQRTLL